LVSNPDQVYILYKIGENTVSFTQSGVYRTTNSSIMDRIFFSEAEVCFENVLNAFRPQAFHCLPVLYAKQFTVY